MEWCDEGMRVRGGNGREEGREGEERFHRLCYFFCPRETQPTAS